jgi:hypothetical protein
MKKILLSLCILSLNSFAMESTLSKDLAIKIINKNCSNQMKMTQKHIKDPDNTKTLISYYNFSCNNLTAIVTKIDSIKELSISLSEKNTKTSLPEINKNDSIDVVLTLWQKYSKSKESINEDIAIKEIIENNKKEEIRLQKMVKAYETKQQKAVSRLSN